VPSLLDVLLAVVALISSFLFIYLCWFTVANLAFWVERLDNINEVVPSLRSFWQLPRSVYGGLVSMLLTFVLPISLMTSLPSEALLGQSPWWLVGYLVLATGVIFYISRLVLKVSLKRYSSVGG
jgi:ABC-2 type transport system permease protein